MQTLGRADLPALFAALREVFAREREALIALDGHVGDSDLGITMNNAFVAAADNVAAGSDILIGKTLQQAGMAIAKAAPSTMGTLTATGFMRAGKALTDATELGTREFAQFWQAYHDGIAERGKAKPGDKTLLDVLGPIAASLAASASQAEPLQTALDAATEAARQALEATRQMVAQHGKAACFPDKSIGLQDAGATVGYLIVDTMRAFVRRDSQQKGKLK